MLSTSGHIAALVNPQGNPKSSFQVNKENPAEPGGMALRRGSVQGTWWTDLFPWLADRCGALKPAPKELGGGGLRPIVAAPGTYVFDH